MNTGRIFAAIEKGLAGLALSFLASNAVIVDAAAECVNVSQVPNQTISSGDVCYSNNGTLTATGVTVNGSASVTFAAGQSIHLGPGFRAKATDPGAAPTTFQAWVALPSVVSVSPSGQSYVDPVFTVTVSDPSGYSNVSEVQFLVNTTVSGTHGCYIRYSANGFEVRDNLNTTWIDGSTPQNSYCTVSASQATVSGSGTQLSLAVPVRFHAPFAGDKTLYVIAYSKEGLNSGWQPMGNWNVPGTPMGPDFTISTAQDTWKILSGVWQTVEFTLTVTPLNGFTGSVWFNASPFVGCVGAGFTPSTVNGPPWTTKLSMGCYEQAISNQYWTAVQASSGGKSHDLTLYLHVTPVQQYSLVPNVSPPGAGIVTLNPQGGWYNSGTQVTVTAIALSGYQFTGFSGSLTGGSPGSVTMDGNKAVTANFTSTAQVAAPSFSPAGGTYSTTQNVTITTTTAGASIYYTLDGSMPSSTNGTPYTGLPVTGTTTIRAIAYKAGMSTSIITTAAYTISAVAAPVFSPAPGTYSAAQNVSITSATSGASIFYTTNGSTPSSTNGTLYSGPVSVPATATIKAIAYKAGMPESAVSSSIYTITPGVVAAPVFSPAGGSYSSAQNVTMTSTTAGATIRYTTDGTNPTSTHGSPYSGPVTVSGATTIKAIAYLPGMTDSPVTSASYVTPSGTSTRREYIRVGGRVIAIEYTQ